ncbi:MAG: murein biosynthesis integral membrane protein MurJ, partial [Armatimonadota bacterium]
TGPGVGATAVLMVASILVSAAVGVVREMVYARQFGATGEYSAFVAAFRIPDLVYFLIAGGALRTGFIPVFTAYREGGRQEQAWRTLQAMFSLMLAFAGAIVGLGILFAPWLARLVAGGEEFTPAQRALCGHLMRVMFPAQVFFVLGGLFMGALNALRHFLWPAMAPIVYNLVLIVFAVAIVPFFPLLQTQVTAQAFGVVTGACVAHFLLQLWVLSRRGDVRPVWDPRDEGVRRMGLFLLPVVFGLAVPEINKIVVIRFATDVTAAGPAILNYADRLGSLSVRAFGGGMAIALYPTLASLFTTGRLSEFRRQVSFGLRNVLFLSLPTVALVVVLREPIIRLLLVRGKFTEADAASLAAVLMWYAIGLVPFAMLGICARSFYALHDTKTPVLVGIGVIATTFIAGLYLKDAPRGLEGCALAWAIGPLVNVVVLLTLLRHRLGGIDGRRLVLTCVKASFATAVACVSAWFSLIGLHALWSAGALLMRVAEAIVPAVVGLGAFVGASWMLRTEEARSAVEFLLRRVRRGTDD